MEDKKKIAKEALKALDELEKSIKVEDIIKDNQAEFLVENIKYRVRKPVYTEQLATDKERRKKYLEFIDDDSYLFQKQWIEKYKKKDIDINEMQLKIKNLQKEIELLLLRLAKISIPEDIEKLKKEILKLRDVQYNLSIEKTDLLSYSIEDQILVFVNSYITYLVLEKYENDKWIRVFEEYEDFLKSKNAELINNAFYYINCIIYQT